MKIKNPKVIGAICFCIVAILRLIYRTVRFDIRYAEPELSPYKVNRTQQCVYTIWHDLLLTPLFAKKLRKTAAVVGAHRDGDYVSHVLKAVDMKSIRGSSSRGGTQAILKSMSLLQDHSLVITPDGPRGPRREMKSGCAFIASQTRVPVVTSAFSCTNCWRFKGSWTDLMIPKPFAKIYAITGPPIHIPYNASREELEVFTQVIQSEMDRLHDIAERLAQGETIPDEVIFQEPKIPTLRAAA